MSRAASARNGQEGRIAVNYNREIREAVDKAYEREGESVMSNERRHTLVIQCAEGAPPTHIVIQEMGAQLAADEHHHNALALAAAIQAALPFGTLYDFVMELAKRYPASYWFEWREQNKDKLIGPYT